MGQKTVRECISDESGVIHTSREDSDTPETPGFYDRALVFVRKSNDAVKYCSSKAKAYMHDLTK